MKILLGLVSSIAFALPLSAQEAVVYPFEGSFDDAAFGVESAIVGRGLVIDYVSHIGDMLKRTGSDVGSGVELFENAQTYVFCSAVVSRKMMELDPLNIAHCPYGVFVMETDQGVSVGYRTYPSGPMQEVQSLLDDIAVEAVE